MEIYNPKQIESKWQKLWAENPELYTAKNASDKPKKYVLDMWPYPSGDGLHVGHVESYTATDILSRYYRMRGWNVLHPQGWDAFGLPAENFAIKTGIPPVETTAKAIATFKSQMNKMGFSYDWSREQNSSDPEYYKWTQWFFLLLYKNGLAYKKKGKVNWCPKCQTVLANEQVVAGGCERCQTEVVQKELEQWYFKITDFIESCPHPSPLPEMERGATSGLLDGLEKIDWPDSIKAAQKNWIGKSEGTTIKFQITNTKSQTNSKTQYSNGQTFLEVFTTRVDTIFGCTYCVIAPEHKLFQELKPQIENWGEVEKYLIDSQSKTELERMETKDKTGVELKGIEVINPFNNEKVPLFVADYVLAQYGTGAVMAVPAHDERDFEFAKKYDLPIKRVIEPGFFQTVGDDKIRSEEPFVERDAIVALVKHWEEEKYLALQWKEVAWRTLITGGVENYKSAEEAARAEILEETGYKNLKLIQALPMTHSKFYHIPKKQNRFAHFHGFYFQLENGEQEKVSDKEKSIHEIIWMTKEEAAKMLTPESHRYILEILDKAESAFIEDGVTNNSGEYNFLNSEEAREKMTEWLEKNNLGKRKINYKIRDWLVSRQRYWGAPIPIIYCEKCGEVVVPEKDLPVMLPTDVDFKPTGESPLAYSKIFHDVKCPQCGGNARRESDTMDTFVCSSWYYFRYADPKNEKEFASKENIKKWLPVDVYVGGAEHAVLHLLYSRFFTKVLHYLGYIDFDEPFLKLRNQGMILAEDGRKMSKSLGNVINPDDIVNEMGSDSLRCFEMFMGPLEDSKPWNTKGIIGLKRFLEKTWNLFDKKTTECNCKEGKCKNAPAGMPQMFHKTIKKVTEDIENFRFNTAISQLMILVNYLSKMESLPTQALEYLLILLSPFAPHIAEELWSSFAKASADKEKYKQSIFLQPWPEYNPELIKDEIIKLVVQINGKIRDTIEVGAEISEEEAKALALQSEKIKSFIGGKEIKKIIFVPGKLINIVI